MRNIVFAFALSLAAFALPAAADTPSDELQYLVGTWNCTTQTATASLSESQTIAAMPGSPWLHATGAMSVKNAPAGSEETYIGYDARNSRFVIVGINSFGTYFISTSSSAVLNGSKWQGAFPAGGSATFTENGSTRYTVDAVAPGGTTTHEVCTRQ